MKYDGYSTLRTVTNIHNGVPQFEIDVAPLEFTSQDADAYMRKLLDNGWIAVTIRAPHDRKYICWN